MDAGDWVQVVVTVVLVGLTGWYAWETRRIVRNMEQDRENMYRPVLTFQVIPWNAVLLKLRIQNVGNGVAVDIDGSIESELKGGKASFAWSYPILCSGHYEEFGFPVSAGAGNDDRYRLEKIQENVIEVRAIFRYKSTTGVNYTLDEIIPINKLTNDWVSSRMLVTEDHPDRIMPRVAKNLEDIKKELHNISQINK